ncbi:MAG: phage tail tube protein [Lachnospiraceae bacterium]|nr:phage tail tube protein [Lachnospiraceae bacterium]
MGNNAIMNSNDAVYGGLAECFITINGRRYNFMSMTEFESKWEVNITDVPVLGKVGMGHKAAGGKGTWSGTAHYNQSYFREIADNYQKTGEMPYFEIQVSNEEPSSVIGRQTIVHRGCLCDNFTLAKFKAGEELLDEELSGTFESWDMPEKFNDMEGAVAN